jgi:orotate phosphoribosyltransferase
MNSRAQAAYLEARREFAFDLEEVGAVLTAASNHPLVAERTGTNGTERGFKLKLHEKNPGAPLSPIYFNLRTPNNPKPGPLTEYLVEMAIHCMRFAIHEKNLSFDAVSGVPRAGDPLADALARLMRVPVIPLEKSEQGGIRKIASLKGIAPASVKKAVVIDDLVTKADSKIEAIEVLRDSGIEVTDVIVLLDREQGGHEELRGCGCTLHSVFTISELLDLYVSAEKMQPELRSHIQSYLALAA